MISIFVHNYKYIVWGVFCACALWLPSQSLAQSFSLSLSPPVYKLELEPGTTYTSVLRVNNPNTATKTYYAETADFAPGIDGDFGQYGAVVQERNNLATWVEVGTNKVTVSPDRFAEIPFSIVVPEDAAPGAHVAAILVGNKPPTLSVAPNAQVATTQQISSLLLVQIAGEVVEQAVVEDFIIPDTTGAGRSADISFTFHNTGNTHVRPEGTITFTNVWGKTYNTLAIRPAHSFETVAPGVRKTYTYTYERPAGLQHWGRHQAVAAISYGVNTPQTIALETTFWSLPIKTVVGFVFTALLILLLLRYGVRLYIRRVMVAGHAGLERVAARESRKRPGASAAPDSAKKHPHQKSAVFLLQ